MTTKEKIEGFILIILIIVVGFILSEFFDMITYGKISKIQIAIGLKLSLILVIILGIRLVELIRKLLKL